MSISSKEMVFPTDGILTTIRSLAATAFPKVQALLACRSISRMTLAHLPFPFLAYGPGSGNLWRERRHFKMKIGKFMNDYKNILCTEMIEV